VSREVVDGKAGRSLREELNRGRDRETGPRSKIFRRSGVKGAKVSRVLPLIDRRDHRGVLKKRGRKGGGGNAEKFYHRQTTYLAFGG